MDRSEGDLLIKMVELYCPVALHIGPSAGRTCRMCEGAIVAGALQYEIRVGRSTIVVDENCYMSSLREIVEAPLARADDRSRA